MFFPKYMCLKNTKRLIGFSCFLRSRDREGKRKREEEGREIERTRKDREKRGENKTVRGREGKKEKRERRE